uniref:D-isomer specific 2-hydroxyacid dehydrogenase NAD-binding domain-containing protein n=1 Tax=Haptolina ericina TaxID=156174 RepID=A0A7S3AQA8_9EUKA|mmetsp:Transcript_30374/g.68575  ORF Transcript_30374/g.68575 Transcript_30374/m.68575 type:complete len:346 (+) Transcript_30374:24-1061(+)
MHLLCTSPIKENWAEELTALGATVTTLEFDGTFEAADDAKFDGAMITSEAFKLYFQGGMSALSVPYDALSALVRSGRVAWVHVCASGLDVPVFFPLMRACHETGTTLTHCPGVYGIPIAQYCIGHMLSVCRMIPQHAINQASRKYESLVQRDIRTCTVGIVGAGGIGAELAKLSKAFGMGTIGWRRNAAPAPNYDEMLSGPDGLDRLLSASDFVVVAIPKTPATEGLIGPAQLRSMKRTAWVINVARGKVVDEAALVTALSAEDQAPAGAVLDVFAVEPLPDNSPLWQLPNVVITPHDSWRTDEALKDNHRYFLDNVGRAARGQPLQGLVAEEYLAPALAAVASL